MSDIERAMDRYEAAAQAAGFEVCAFGASFDKAAASAALSARGLWRNDEQFTMLERWNGPILRSPAGETSLAVHITSHSFETALRYYDDISPLAEEFDDNPEYYKGMFPVLEVDQHDIVAYYSSGQRSNSLFKQFEDESVELFFPSLASFFQCAAAAIESGIDPTFYLSNPDWERASSSFAEICAKELPGLNYWQEVLKVQKMKLGAEE